jgi:hypothetical protein
VRGRSERARGRRRALGSRLIGAAGQLPFSTRLACTFPLLNPRPPFPQTRPFVMSADDDTGMGLVNATLGVRAEAAEAEGAADAMDVSTEAGEAAAPADGTGAGGGAGGGGGEPGEQRPAAQEGQRQQQAEAEAPPHDVGN